MKNKRNKIIISIVVIVLIILMIVLFIVKKNMKSSTYNKVSEETTNSKLEIEVPIVKQSDAKAIDLNSIIDKNEQDVITESISKQETDIEFNTQYRQNDSLAKGKIQTLQ